jgi:hypothetical protein
MSNITNLQKQKANTTNEEFISIKYLIRPVKSYKLTKISFSNFKDYSSISQIGYQTPSGKQDTVLQIIIKFQKQEIIINNENDWNKFIQENFDEINGNHNLKQNNLKLEFEYISALQNYIMNSSPEEIFNNVINAILNNHVIRKELKLFFENEMKNSSKINRNNNEIVSQNKNTLSSVNQHNKNSVDGLIVSKLTNLQERINNKNKFIEQTTILNFNESELFGKDESLIKEKNEVPLQNLVESIILPKQELEFSVLGTKDLPLHENTVKDFDIDFEVPFNNNKKLTHQQILLETVEISKRSKLYNNINNENK